MANKRTCLCCGREYKYCPTCGADSSKPKWMVDFCSETCKDLFNAVSAVGMGADKNVLQKVVNIYQIKDFSIYKDSIKNALEQLNAAEQKRLEKVRGKKNKVQDEAKAIEEIAEIETQNDIELENNGEVSE